MSIRQKRRYAMKSIFFIFTIFAISLHLYYRIALLTYIVLLLQYPLKTLINGRITLSLPAVKYPQILQRYKTSLMWAVLLNYR